MAYQTYDTILATAGFAGEYEALTESEIAGSIVGAYSPSETGVWKIVASRIVQLLKDSPVNIATYQTSAATIRVPSGILPNPGEYSDALDGRFYFIRNDPSAIGPVTIQRSDGTQLGVLTPGDFIVLLHNSSDTWFFQKINTQYTYTTDPTVNNDQTQGYQAGDIWVNTATLASYICVSAATGAAQWVTIGQSGGTLASLNAQYARAVKDWVYTGTTDSLVTGISPDQNISITPGAGSYECWFTGAGEISNGAQQLFTSMWLNGNGVGTVAVTASTAVVGTGTKFQTTYNVGDSIQFASQVGTYYQITTITDDTHMTISRLQNPPGGLAVVLLGAYNGTPNAATTINLQKIGASDRRIRTGGGNPSSFAVLAVVANISSTQAIEGRASVSGATGTIHQRTMLIRKM
jgi:hypothetical protein